MANRIKGITIDINGDSTGLNKALENVEKKSKQTSSELKDINKQLKFDPSNTELLSQKQTVLKEAIGATKEKLEQLKNAEAQVQAQAKRGDITQEQYRAFQREISATESYLNHLENEAKQTNDVLGQTAEQPKSKFQQLKDKIKEAGNSASDSAKGGFTVMKGALANLAAQGIQKAVSGLKSLIGKFTELGQKADDINTLSKQTGISTEDLQKMEYASELIDVEVSDITSSLKKMKKNMTSTSSATVDAWAQLGISVRNGNGELRNSTDVFYETLEALSKVSNETERDTLAMTLFGKSADSLAGIVDDGGQALRQMGDEAERVGAVMSQDTLDNANKFNDAIDKIKATGQGVFAQIGGEIAEELAPELEEMQSEFQEWISSDEGKEFIHELAEGIKGLIHLIVDVVKFVVENKEFVVGAIMAVVTAVNVLNAVLLANPIGLIIEAIGLVIAAIVLLAENWDEVCNAISEAWDAVCEFFATLWDKNMEILTGAWNFIKGIGIAIGEFFKGIWDGIANSFKSVWNGIKSFFSDFWEGLKNVCKSGINGIIRILNGMISAVNVILTPLRAIIMAVGNLFGAEWSLNDVAIPKIPMLAKGGKMTSGSAIFGEAGPELLTVANGTATVTPLTSSDKGGTSAGNSYEINIETVNNYDSQSTANEMCDMIMERIEFKTMRKGMAVGAR